MRSSLLFCLFFLVTTAAAAQGRARIEISGADFRPVPLALSAATGPEKEAALLTQTLREDLEVSGLFSLLDPASFLVDPAKEGVTVSAIDFAKWRAVGADVLVKARLRSEGDSIQAEFFLFDVMGGRKALEKSWTAPPEGVRSLAHRFADALVTHFTSEPGIFQTQLAYVTRKAGVKEVWVSDWDGHNAEQLTFAQDLSLLPAWSPDGRRLAFTSYLSGFPMLHLLDVSTKAVTALPARGDLQTGAAWSPDGQRIAFTMSQEGNSNVFVMNADGSDLKQLTQTRSTESSPSWSPDGRRIAFVSTRSGDPQIFVMNADGSGVERLTFQGRYNQTPAWSPRGDLIAFTARDERNKFDLFVVEVATKTIRRLTQDQGNNEEPSWAPNGRHLVFSSTRSGPRRLYIMNADGTNQRRLAIEAEASTPAWGPLPDSAR